VHGFAQTLLTRARSQAVERAMGQNFRDKIVAKS